MLRTIIKIDEEKCNGCGLCVNACHEGAIGMQNGKAVLLRDDYCDGLGNCLPVCPTGAITFEEREALPFDEKAVEEKLKQQTTPKPFAGCPGSMAKTLEHKTPVSPASAPSPVGAQSQLMQWPVQLRLVPVNAPYFQNAKLLLAADCSAFAYPHFHEDFMKGHVTLIACPKLDPPEIVEKLTEILLHNSIKSITVARMEVPCCGGLEQALIEALKNSQKIIPWHVAIIGTEGQLLDES